MTWAAPLYSYKKKITIDKTKVAGDEVNFPALVSVTDANLKSIANGGHVRNSSGYDICFYDSTEKTLLYHEIESYTATTGVVVFWVCIASLSSTSDTIFYMYYGNPAISTDPSSTSVWDTNFVMVQHLYDITTSTTNDSTTNNNDGAKTAANNPNETGGQIARGQDFDGTDDIITVIDSASLSGPAKLTLEAWIQTTALEYAGIVTKDWGAAGNREYILVTGSDAGNTAIWIYNFSTTTANFLTAQTIVVNIMDGTWHHIVATWNGVNAVGNMVIYIDGVSRALNTDAKSGTGCVPYNGSAPVEMGRYAKLASTCFDGIIDETRISKINRSANWVSTEYKNQNAPTTFLSLGRELRRAAKSLHLGNQQHILNRMDLT